MSNIIDNESTADDTHLLTGARCYGRGGFWETRTRCERRLLVLAITMVILIVALVITLVVLEEQEHKLSDFRLQKLTEELLSIDKDNNNVFDQLDITPEGSKLLSGPTAVFFGPTIAPLMALQLDFHPKVNVPEIFSEMHKNNQKQFLNAIMDTEVMKRTEKILTDTELIQKPLMEVLENMWFSLYSRSTTQKVVNGSSGFEHVFVGETSTKNKKVSGFHNWVYFFYEQDNPQPLPNLTYSGSQGMLELGNKGDVISMNFTWLNKTKSNGSMFIGTSPELEMAVYTICFLARPDMDCPVSMAGKQFTIKTFAFKNTKLLGSAYPDMKSHVFNRR